MVTKMSWKSNTLFTKFGWQFSSFCCFFFLFFSLFLPLPLFLLSLPLLLLFLLFLFFFFSFFSFFFFFFFFEEGQKKVITLMIIRAFQNPHSLSEIPGRLVQWQLEFLPPALGQGPLVRSNTQNKEVSK